MCELTDSNSPLELLGQLQPEDFLGEGFDLKPDGGWYCRFCEVSVEEIDKHLHPHYNVAKRRRRHYRDCARKCANHLLTMGWQLNRGLTFGE